MTEPVKSPANVITGSGLFKTSAQSIDASIVPLVPLKTSEVLVASGIKVNLPVLSLNPKNPTLAAVPLCQRNSIPRSLLSSLAGAVSPPSVKTGSSTVTVVEFTVVVVPLTVKLLLIVVVLFTYSCPAILVPPSTINAPVPVPVEFVEFVLFNTPPVLTLPASKLPAMYPTPKLLMFPTFAFPLTFSCYLLWLISHTQ